MPFLRVRLFFIFLNQLTNIVKTFKDYGKGPDPGKDT